MTPATLILTIYERDTRPPDRRWSVHHGAPAHHAGAGAPIPAAKATPVKHAIQDAGRWHTPHRVGARAVSPDTCLIAMAWDCVLASPDDAASLIIHDPAPDQEALAAMLDPVRLACRGLRHHYAQLGCGLFRDAAPDEWLPSPQRLHTYTRLLSQYGNEARREATRARAKPPAAGLYVTHKRRPGRPKKIKRWYE